MNFIWLINLWLFKSETELLAGKAHGGGVDNRHQLLRVLCQQLVEQLLVSLKKLNLLRVVHVQGVFFNWPPPVQYRKENRLTSQSEAFLDEEFHGTAALVG